MITRERTGIIFEQAKIPEGHIRCPQCKGSGRIRWRWSEPFGGNNPGVSDFSPCLYCMGKGHLDYEIHLRMVKLDLDFKLSRLNWDWFYDRLYGGQEE